MKHITLNIGTERRGDGLPLTERERLDGMHRIEKVALDLFGSVTISPAWGGWRNPAGEVVTEETLQIDIVTESPTAGADALTLAQEAKQALGQQSVLLYTNEVESELV